MKFLKDGESDIKTIATRILKRDFSGNTGLAIKNSTYQFSYNLISKLGSLIFVIILARIILPETFGLYNLALSTIMFFYVFSDLGINQALIYFSSKALHKNKTKAKAYINYLFKIKLFLTLASTVILIALAKLISENYYQQPIFLALIAGSLYLFFTALQSFYMSLAQSNNDFKSPFIKEIFLQGLKIVLIPLALIYFKKIDYAFSNVSVIFSSLSVISILCTFVIYHFSTKNLRLAEIKTIQLTRKEKGEVKSFIFKISLVISSILLLGNIDKIIIGPFVPPEFIGYYSAAFSMVNASAFLLIFSDVFFPIFLRMKGARLKRAFDKSVLVTIIPCILLFVFLLIFAPLLIKLIFGENYLASINMLRMLALLAILFPLIEIYTSYIISKGRLDKITKVILLIIFLSVGLPLLFVKLFLSLGYSAAVFGLILGVILSKAVHLLALVLISRKI